MYAEMTACGGCCSTYDDRGGVGVRGSRFRDERAHDGYCWFVSSDMSLIEFIECTTSLSMMIHRHGGSVYLFVNTETRLSALASAASPSSHLGYLYKTLFISIGIKHDRFCKRRAVLQRSTTTCKTTTPPLRKTLPSYLVVKSRIPRHRLYLPIRPSVKTFIYKPTAHREQDGSPVTRKTRPPACWVGLMFT
jgi:hypothetical protein